MKPISKIQEQIKDEDSGSNLILNDILDGEDNELIREISTKILQNFKRRLSKISIINENLVLRNYDKNMEFLLLLFKKLSV